jgi:hypothetical protein
MRVETTDRPYTLVVTSDGGSAYSLTREETDRLIAEYAVTDASRKRVVLRNDDGQLCEILPATPDGGPAFVVHR